jgi:hypothetical protein
MGAGWARVRHLQEKPKKRRGETGVRPGNLKFGSPRETLLRKGFGETGFEPFVTVTDGVEPLLTQLAESAGPAAG